MECNANGHISLKEKVPASVIETLINAEFLVEDAPDGGLWLTMDERSYNDQVEDSMKRIAPYVDIGDVEFIDIEDGYRWRYEFDGGKCFYAEAEVTFIRKMEVI